MWLCDIICVLASQIAHQKKSTSPKSSKQTKSSFLWCSFSAGGMTWKPLKTHSWSYSSAHQVRKKWAHLVTFIITSTALLHDLFIGVCQLLQGQNKLLLPRNFPTGWKYANKNPRCCREYLHAPKASPTYPANGCKWPISSYINIQANQTGTTEKRHQKSDVLHVPISWKSSLSPPLSGWHCMAMRR